MFYDLNEEDWGSMFTSAHSGKVISAFLAGESHCEVQESLFGPDNRVASELPSGTKVSFVFTVESALSYRNPPLDGEQGTIVRMRSSHGNITHDGDFMFVQWDDGRIQATHFNHLKKTGKEETHEYKPGLVGKVKRMRVSSLGILGDEFVTRNANELIHKATKDLWSFTQGDDGYVIERLFDDSNGPLKV